MFQRQLELNRVHTTRIAMEHFYTRIVHQVFRGEESARTGPAHANTHQVCKLCNLTYTTWGFHT